MTHNALAKHQVTSSRMLLIGCWNTYKEKRLNDTFWRSSKSLPREIWHQPILKKTRKLLPFFFILFFTIVNHTLLTCQDSPSWSHSYTEPPLGHGFNRATNCDMLRPDQPQTAGQSVDQTMQLFLKETNCNNNSREQNTRFLLRLKILRY